MSAVVIVLGVIAAVAVPLVDGWMGMAPAAGARVVIADLMFAQSRAVATQTTQFVGFGPDAYTLYDAQPFATPVIDPVTMNPYVVAVGENGTGGLAGVSVTSLTLDDPANSVLAFNELGQPLVCSAAGPPVPLASTGAIVLKRGAVTVTIYVEPGTGNLTVSN